MNPPSVTNSAQTLAEIDAAYKAYYDAASESELAEEFAWAQYAENEFAKLAVSELSQSLP